MENKMKEGISCLEILILIIAVFSFAYIMQAGLVSAQEEVCCEKTKQGVWCQNAESSECDSDCGDSECRISPVLCEDTGFCELGCCYDAGEGLCSLRTNKASCNEQWFADELCNIPQCQKACCLFGSNAEWATEKECYRVASYYGLQGEWRQDIQNEFECVMQTQLQEQGACVFEQDFENNCIFTTAQECKRITGSFSGFNKGYLCSNPESNTICQKQHHTGCIAGKDGVYWFDSCGNRENIYSSNKVRSWNNGYMKDKDEICQLRGDLSNADKCGNCDYFFGSICARYDNNVDEEKPTYGDYVCRDLNCEVEVDGNKVEKKNGESWCSFDGAIGEENSIARDVVGSRHWRHVCIDGEEIIEPCGDYRNEVCVEQEDENTDRTYSACRTNKWAECLSFNFGETRAERKSNLEKCETHPDCWVKEISIDKFKFKTCAPKYPPGFEFMNEDPEINGENICNIGSQTCTVVYTKDWRGDCEPEVNENCLKPVFTKKMNELCVSLGDCGGFVNIEGEYTDEGFNVKSGVKKLKEAVIEEYKKFANPLLWAKQKVDAGDMNLEPSYLGVLGEAKAPDVKGAPISQKTADALMTIIIIDAILMALTGNILFLIGDIILLIGTYLFGIGDICKKKYVKFECMPWQPPLGGDDCEKCNDDNQCSKYRCQSLGQACELINEGTDQERCVNTRSGDTISPIRSPLLEFISQDHKYADIRDIGFQIQSKTEQCIQAFTNVSFGIKTDELATCRFDFERKEFEEMENNFGFGEEHKLSYVLPSAESLASYFEVPIENVTEKYGKIDFYVRCRDVMGNTNEDDYVVRMCVSKEPDKTPPMINAVVPTSGSYVAYDETEKDINVFVSEPSECKWSKTDKDYEIMENSMECKTELDNQLIGGWVCETTLTNLVPGNNLFYFRCKDNPHLNESDRNAMRQSYNYILKKSESQLHVDVEPVSESEADITEDNGIYEILAGVDPISVKLTAKTSGGAEDGKATCEWQETEKGWSDYFPEDSAIHESYALPLTEDTYSFDITCKDIAGNTAEGSISLSIELDTEAPIITRAYYYEGKLKVMTNEDSSCAYSFNNCSYNIGNRNLMTGEEKEHTTKWKVNKIYYIKCKDKYGNVPDCSIIIKTHT